MRMETKRKSHLVLAAVLLLLVVGAAWAGISDGVLNNNDTDIDLTQLGYYSGGNATRPITLGSNSIILTGNLTLGDPNTVLGFAANANDMASDAAAGGAIRVDVNQTLDIKPGSGKSVRGTANVSALRIYGRGTTNLYRGGTANSYANTFVQSGTLNIDHKDALGGSVLILGGGATLGMTGSARTIDLTGTTVKLRRYDGGVVEPDGLSDMVTFNTGESATNTMTLPALEELTALPGYTPVKLVKDGLGTLVLMNVPGHSGGMMVERGVLELRASPKISQTAEIKRGATFAAGSGISELNTVTAMPAAGSAIRISSSLSGTASATTSGTGTAALTISGFDTSNLGENDQFSVDADLSGITLPSEADQYYVKLIYSRSAHNLAATNVSFSGANPVINGGTYSVAIEVDTNNIYAVLTRSAAATENVSISWAKEGNTITATARLTDLADGAAIRFILRDADGATVSDTTQTSSNGGAATQTFTSLTYQTYTLTVSASGYNGYSGEIKIDGSSSVQGSLVVTVYDVYEDSSSNKPTALRVNIDNSPSTFPSGASFKYNFIQTGGTATGVVANPVTDATTFTANNVTFSNDRSTAIFDINLSNLRADDGQTYALVPGLTYRIQIVEASSSSGSSSSSGVSDALVDSNGQYVSSGSLMIATYAQTKTRDTIAAWAIVTKNGVVQPNVSITFTLLDMYGNAVNVAGVNNTPTQITGDDGRADVSFGPLPDNNYIIRTTVSGVSITGYSRDVRLGSSSSSGGGCDAGFGLLALALAFAAVKRKKG